MSLFAHVESGFAADVHDAPDAETYTKWFASDLAEKWNIVLVPDGTQPGAKYNQDGTVNNPKPAQPPAPSLKTSGLSYDEFRKLFTVAEATKLDSFAFDDRLTALGVTPLTAAEKATMENLFAEARATGAANAKGVNLLSPKMAPALKFLEDHGFIAIGRAVEIATGAVKS